MPGTLNTSLKTDVLVEDVRNADYGKLRIGGWCQMKDVNIFIPKDSIVMNVKSAGLVLPLTARIRSLSRERIY